jgi:hypothetical protein
MGRKICCLGVSTDLSEMGDAVLGLVAQEMGSQAPPWIAVRNVSDPQIDASGLTLK